MDNEAAVEVAWIESHTSLARHPKTLRLARALGASVPCVIGHLHLLWWWALDYAPDGDLSTFDPSEIELACMWEGKDDQLWDALTKGFVDPDGRLHDWDDYAGKLLDQRRANAQRQREWRERKTDTSQPPEPSPNKHVTVTSPLRNSATVPNRTVPNRTEEEGIPEPLMKAQDVLVPFVSRGFIPDRDNLLKVGLTYPNLDLDLEFRKLADWLRADRNRKEQCSWRRIFNWLKRAEEYRQTNAHKNGTIEYPPPPMTEPTNGAVDLTQAFAEARKQLASR